MRYQKTEAGQQAFKQRTPLMSARQRAAFLLFDGQRPLEVVLSSTAGLGVTPADILDLVEKEFLQAPVAQAGASAAPATENPTPSAPTPANDKHRAAELYQRAYPVATRITADLGLRGFRLNLAVEAASGYHELVALLPAIAKSAPAEAVRELAKALGVPPPP
ncbi:MAG: hypothetical protein JNK17_06220 [Hydrogenophaga sp.]|nr:hypothetical protein [Hydrogenophaga sp.]